MKTITIDLPDNLVAATHDYVKAGFFCTESDVMPAAIAKFVRRNKIDLIERFALEDIEWAKEEAGKVK